VHLHRSAEHVALEFACGSRSLTRSTT
jgi:hypothetical protein